MTASPCPARKIGCARGTDAPCEPDARPVPGNRMNRDNRCSRYSLDLRVAQKLLGTRLWDCTRGAPITAASAQMRLAAVKPVSIPCCSPHSGSNSRPRLIPDGSRTASFPLARIGHESILIACAGTSLRTGSEVMAFFVPTGCPL
jgi:hypothetical protein